MALKNFEPSKYIQTILISFILIEAVSYIVSQYSDYPILKLGWLLSLSLIIIAMSSLFTLGISIDTMKKESIIFILIVVAAVLALLFFLPQIIPEIFSAYNPSGIEYSNLMKQNLNSILGGI